MPQLDIFTYRPQLAWIIMFTFVLYYIIVNSFMRYVIKATVFRDIIDSIVYIRVYKMNVDVFINIWDLIKTKSIFPIYEFYYNYAELIILNGLNKELSKKLKYLEKNISKRYEEPREIIDYE